MIPAGGIPGTASGRAVNPFSRGRIRGGLACAALAAMVAGCSTAASAPTVTGKKLDIYLSAPASLSGNAQAQDVIDAEKLAFSSACTSSCPPIQIGGFTVHLNILSASKISDNARTAIEDTNAVGYLGEVQPGDSVDSLGITNAEDVLQVSPAQDASVPTKDFESYSTYGRTFASMAPSNDATALLGGSAGRLFKRDFSHAYGHSPSSQAIFGYVATSAMLKALREAGSASSNRGTVRNMFFGLKDVSLPIGQSGPVLGTYTVNKNGTVTITPASS